jgi:hypothetical protein
MYTILISRLLVKYVSAFFCKSFCCAVYFAESCYTSEDYIDMNSERACSAEWLATLLRNKSCLVLISCLVNVMTVCMYKVLVQVCTHYFTIEGHEGP